MADPYLNQILETGVLQKAHHYHGLLDGLGEDFFWRDWNKQNKNKLAQIMEEIVSEDAHVHTAFILTTIDKVGDLRKLFGVLSDTDCSYMNLHSNKKYPRAAVEIITRLFRRKLPFEEIHYLYLLNRTADLERISCWNLPYLKSLVTMTEKCFANRDITSELNAALGRLSDSLEWIDNAAERKLRARIDVLRGGPRSLSILPGEAWSDQALFDFESMDNDQKEAWILLLAHCERSDSGTPSKKWTAEAEKLLGAVNNDSFLSCVCSWFSLVDKPRTQLIEHWSEWVPNPNLMICEFNASILKGLVWCCSFLEGKPIARALRDLAVSAYKKVPGIGPRAVKIGNACIYSLGSMEGMDGLHQLAYLKVKVRFKTALKLIDKMLNETAQRLEIPREDLEEMSVPGYGLTDVGLLEEPLGDFTARIEIHSDNKIELKWMKPDGKLQKSVPASVKNDYADSLKELKATIKDIQKMIPAQKERIQSVYLQQKQWDYSTWKERYLDHPLVGTLARRLLWTFTQDDMTIDGIYFNGQMIDIDGNDLGSRLNDSSQVQLWHPIGHDVDSVKRWRLKLAELEIRQPFKQLHREVYILTDAERQTGIYSNRYAAHIVKQHQFNSLCAARGWYNTLKLMVDDDFPPASILLPKWNLRAEFWTDGVGDEYGEDTNDTGTFYYLATDQVRFFPANAPQTYAHAYNRGQEATASPVSLDDIPALVFSEVMRDIDLFVGVASVGNDPEWTDAGPEGHQTYWYQYSFGDLSQQAETRKDVLMELVPRLAIAEQCRFDGKFLRVQGKIRAYKIHLGSGNILMEPNDSYLCIVRNRTQEMKDGTSKLFLPFEGDQTLSVIISKALLLAHDDRIKDATIVSQIKKF